MNTDCYHYWELLRDNRKLGGMYNYEEYYCKKCLTKREVPPWDERQARIAAHHARIDAFRHTGRKCLACGEEVMASDWYGFGTYVARDSLFCEQCLSELNAYRLKHGTTLTTTTSLC